MRILPVVLLCIMFGCSNNDIIQTTQDENIDFDCKIAASDTLWRNTCVDSTISIDSSRVLWNNLKKNYGNTYIYSTAFCSWSGYGVTDSILVVDGSVKEVVCKVITAGDHPPEIDSVYKITSADAQIRNYLTIDEIYDFAKSLDTLSRSDYSTSTRLWKYGILSWAGYTRIKCVDDCTDGYRINKLTFITTTEK